RSYAESGGPETTYGALGVGMGPLFTPHDSYRSVRAAALEMLSCGVTTTHNWAHNIITPEHADAELQALRDVGIRHRFSYGYYWTLGQTEPTNLADVRRVHDEWTGPMTRVGLALRNDTTQGTASVSFGPLSVSPDLLAQEMAFARDHGIPLTMHIRNPGPAEYFIDRGYIGPDCLVVHGYHWDDDTSWRRLADAGARVSVSPYTAMILNSTLIPLGPMLDAGVPTGLSFDHMNESGGADMFRLMQATVVNESLRVGEPLPWRTAVRLATIDGARLLGIDDVTGSLTPGKRADLVVLDARRLTMAPVHDLAMTVACSAGPAAVTLVMVDGEVLVRDGALARYDQAGIADDLEALFREKTNQLRAGRS
ncbi:MAG TPA: amidohydrolase family protein, partial [Actinomycetales bacterium]|nr:amidohydrolase family protein [Actinomycetales bacterium]